MVVFIDYNNIVNCLFQHEVLCCDFDIIRNMAVKYNISLKNSDVRNIYFAYWCVTEIYQGPLKLT
jgi:hypothetical protein